MKRRALFTGSNYFGWHIPGMEDFPPKLRPDKNGPVKHAGRIVWFAGNRKYPPVRKIKPVWVDDRTGAFRIGRTDDMRQMLDDLGVSDRAF